MTSLAWRSLITLSLPLALGACPGDDSVVDDGLAPSSTGAESTTTGAQTSTGSAQASSSGAADSSSGGTTPADTTTDAASTSTGPAADSGDTTSEISVCGNNIVEANEACDLAQLNGETCQSLGYQGGQLGCLLTCTDYNLLGCFICGNGEIDLAEDCEGTVPEEVTCESLGYEAGAVTCGDDCLYDLGDCSLCGDGIRQGPENCDGIDYGGNTCQSIGFDEGTLGCNVPTCTYDVSGCSGGQYVQGFEAGVMPPEFTLGGTSGFVVDNNMPIVGGFSAHNADIGDSQTSSMTLTAVFGGPGTVSFSHRETTEGCCDFLRFFVDGVEVQAWSGTTAAQQFTTNVAAGMHTLEWRYTKDVSISTGADAVWVDDIALVPGVPI